MIILHNIYDMNVIVSFPRSGQHLIESVLRFLCTKIGKEFSYCEFYNCCKNLPCEKGSFFSKNHDFQLNLNIKDDSKYLVLYRRDIILQLESYFRFQVGKEYEYDNLLNFIRDNSLFYSEFINKWVYKKYDNVLSVEYYDFVNNPSYYSKLILSHFFNDVDFDDSIFEDLIKTRLIVFSGKKQLNMDTIRIQNEINIELYQKIKKDIFS